MDATGWLFGERVSGRPEQYPDVRRLLGAIASAYANRSYLRKPARVVYATLKNDRQVESRYLHNPRAFLPEEFSRQAGLLGPAPEFKPAVEPEPELELPPAEPEALEWFVRLVRTSKNYLNWATYHCYLENADLIRCDLEKGEFVITAEDERSAAWLNAHLVPNLQNDLLGIARRRFRVSFEVWPPAGPGGSEPLVESPSGKTDRGRDH